MKDKAIDQILDLLLDALQERQNARGDEKEEENNQQSIINSQLSTETNVEPEVAEQPEIEPESAEAVEEAEEVVDYTAAFRSIPEDDDDETADAEIEDDYELIPEKLPSINMNKIFYRLSLSLALLIVIVNVPFNRFGTNLARAMPDEKALVVRDVLIFTGPGDEIYILENNEKRWISSLAAFELSGFRWEQVQEVDQTFVDQFEDGPNFNALVRCRTQPHIYVLEGNEKRWIENPTEFERAGFVWDEVRYISCLRLKSDYPDGIPIPPDAGDPPSW